MVDRATHSEIYNDHGKRTNMVESYFSRLRNMIQGQNHGVSPKYMHHYAKHSAWMEDNRRTDNGTLANIIVLRGVNKALLMLLSCKRAIWQNQPSKDSR